MNNQNQTNLYTKKQLHEAFTTEHHARKNTEKNLKRQQQEIAELKYDLKKTQEQYLRCHIKNNIPIPEEQDMEVVLDALFSQEYFLYQAEGRYFIITKEKASGVIVSYIWFMFSSKVNIANTLWAAEIVLDLLKDGPVLFTGTCNHFKSVAEKVEDTPGGPLFSVGELELQNIITNLKRRK